MLPSEAASFVRVACRAAGEQGIDSGLSLHGLAKVMHGVFSFQDVATAHALQTSA